MGALLRATLPAALLVGIAGMQLVLTRTADLSPWKGGGFGMFATLDGTATRYVRLIVHAPDRSEEIAMQPSLEDLAAKAQLFPSHARMTRLAEAIAARERRYQRPVTSVTVQVWRTGYVPAPLRARDGLLRELTVSVAESQTPRP